jgi:hypothetical protein
VDYTINIKCLHYGSHCRCLEDDESCCFFYFSFQKLLTHVASGMAEKVWFTVGPKILKIFFIFFIFFKKIITNYSKQVKHLLSQVISIPGLKSERKQTKKKTLNDLTFPAFYSLFFRVTHSQIKNNRICLLHYDSHVSHCLELLH